MRQKGRTGWIIGVVVTSALCLFMSIIFLTAVSEISNNSGPTMSVDEMGAHSYRASELYCAGIYYTDKALTTDPKQTDYHKWKSYVDKADEYWEALEYELDLIVAYADTEGFQEAFDDNKAKLSTIDKLSNYLMPVAYAIDTQEIMQTYNGAKAGEQLQAVADYLGRDIEYAKSALKVAKGEIDAQKWNDHADTMFALESAARVTKTAAQGALLVIGAPAAGTAALSVQGATFAISGASMIWQVIDDGCFIAMGDNYDNNEFVANLNGINDAAATINFASGMLSMNFSAMDDAVLASYDFAETMRGLLQDGKVAGIQLSDNGGNVVSLTKDELFDYRQAKENGQKLPDDIQALLDLLDADEPRDLPTVSVTADKHKAMVEEWITFTVDEDNSDYSYVFEYGGNKNPQSTNTFKYMYQVPGNYSMRVTVLDANGKAIAKGSCAIEVLEVPTPTPAITPDVTPEVTPIATQQLTQSSKGLEMLIGEWYASGTAFSLDDTQNINNMTPKTSGGYLTIYSDGSYELIERAFKSDGTIENARTTKDMISYDETNGFYIMYGVFGGQVDCKAYYNNGYIYMNMPDTGTDVTAYVVFKPKVRIEGTFGSTYKGTTSKVTFNGDGTGRYVLTGNMEMDQSFTYTIVPFMRYEQTGVKYQVRLALSEGMQPSFDVYLENIVNGEITKLGKDMVKK